ncbi:Alpha/Beta hydrolase protein [Xylogone sp. PMI_703]|nr:Alpha/Beta hydrolase protein [Xylogone sp. PMI_703]
MLRPHFSKMLVLSPDESFHFELLRTLSHARYYGADVNEVLQAAGKIEPGNFESYYTAFNDLANRVNSQADQIDSAGYPVSARDAYFRASNYYRAADFYLHANSEDSRIMTLWEKQTSAFDNAIALMPIPGKRILLKGEGFDIPAIYYAASADNSKPRPTVIMGNGFDGSQEEMLHSCGFAALERGYNVITYEGPGQPSVRRYQNLGFIAEWEKAVTPVIDYLETLLGVDSSKIALLGFSMGGWLCLRAAAFEHRLSAAFAIDGVYDVFQAFSNTMGPQMRALLEAGDPNSLDGAVKGFIDSGKAPTGLRWGIEQGKWSFAITSAAEFMKKTRAMTLKGIEDQIKCPVWVGEAANDQFFQGQPEMVRDALGGKATYVKLTDSDAAGNHCHIGASVIMNQHIFDWFEDTISQN